MIAPGHVHNWVRRLDVEKQLDNDIYLRHCQDSQCGLLQIKKGNSSPSTDEDWVTVGWVRTSAAPNAAAEPKSE